jgi:hypothetical protein
MESSGKDDMPGRMDLREPGCQAIFRDLEVVEEHCPEITCTNASKNPPGD